MRLWIVVVLGVLCRAALCDQPAPHPGGHSLRGEVFNEGPRQAAILIPGTGKVNFPYASTNEQAQKFFQQGVGQLHGFWNYEAERSFRQASKLDPESPMPYWGMAMANTIFSAGDPARAAKFLEEAEKRLAKADEHEKMWIESLKTLYASSSPNFGPARDRYAKALKAIYEKFPNDVEAKAMAALEMWEAGRRGAGMDADAVDKLLDEVFAANPEHPAHHYRIHLWNGRDAEKAVGSLPACGYYSPAIAHMWHMPGHIYWELKKYPSAAWHQEASARVDHAYMKDRRVMPYQIHNYIHNNQWLAYSLSLNGNPKKAFAVAKSLIDMPAHPEKNPMDGDGAAGNGFDGLLQIVADNEDWATGATLPEPPPVGGLALKSFKLFAGHLRGVSRYRLGDARGLRDAVDSLDGIGKDMVAGLPEFRRAGAQREVDSLLDELKAGEKILTGGDKASAVETLKKLPNGRILAHADFLIENGEGDKIESVARSLATGRVKQATALAKLVYVLYKRGKKDEAKTKFGELAAVSEAADLDAPLFKRLAPIAQEFGLAADWRKPEELPAGAREKRPDLARLGPLAWEPADAPAIRLPDSNGAEVQLADNIRRGKPTLVVMYLGGGCLQCVEQMKALVPVAPRFKDAGIEILAIGTDTPAKLKTWLERMRNDGVTFPFPLLSDPSAVAFKAYRAYDDFEGFPMHGVFLVDATGKLRWQEISAYPFKDLTFLLDEAKRLFKL